MDALRDKWFDAMRHGDFSTAWRISDRVLRLRRPGETSWHLPRHEQWVWNGRPLAGQRVLVRCYHGLGDTIQFARFLPRLSKIAANTTVWVQSPLIPLLRTLDCDLTLLPLQDGSPDVDYDVDIELMELSHALRVDIADVAENIPYFHVPASAQVVRTQHALVGIAAATGGWNARRSVPPDLMLELVSVPGVQFVNLQLESRLSGIADVSTPDILQLAERLAALDLVIVPDTMLAHLAGALGVPTWTLLPFDADWRWMQPDRSDSPWYPSMRLFRQPRPGDWNSIVGTIRGELRRLVDMRQLVRIRDEAQPTDSLLLDVE